MDLDGANFRTLHSFAGFGDGLNPSAGLTLVGSKLYGTTTIGGVRDGTVFSMSLDGTNFQILHSFTGGSDGRHPMAGLTAVGSKLYGTAAYGGTADDGTVFSMNLDGSDFQAIHAFVGSEHGDGIYPDGDLASIGSTLYGTTTEGGFTSGIVFSITVPEPDSVLLAGVAVVGLLAYALRKRNSRRPLACRN